MRATRLIPVLLLAAGVTASAPAGAQTPEPSEEGDGLLHAMLVLEAQSIDVAFTPDLSADDAANRTLLDGTAGTRVRIGTIEGHQALRIGELAPDLEALAETYRAAAAVAAAAAAADSDSNEPDTDEDEADETEAEASNAEAEGAEEAPPELWLAREAHGWRLEVVGYEDDADGEIRAIPLSHRESAEAAPVLTASAMMTNTEEGQLTLRWGPHVWSADFRFDELPERPGTPRVSGRGQSREASTDTTAFSRGVTLAERNESALILPGGERISLLYWKGIDVEDEDYSRFEETADGDVVELVRAAPVRIKSDVGLRFGEMDLPTGNLAPGFAGAYAIWLRRSGDGWRLVFNNEPDSWGTRHDPEFDAVEVAVDYTRGDRSFRPLGGTLVPTGADRGRLLVHWGPHEWTADFTIAR
ncbi:MAG: DUF2911 domain-containing protein [Acidobacteria bacterium]|nr:DUF2911 domain-containing protein [Acidobacteriota bacterium]MYD69249.1 DUF2911 domain-containing protein [Acidobacteriota bacterium]MYJ05697.1 DUF2911 domain-containing protein [Acidobacteriota bacterium]